MAAIRIRCSHQTSYLSADYGLTVESVKAAVCPDAEVTMENLTIMRRHLSADGKRSYHLYVKEALPSPMVEFTLTFNGEVMDTWPGDFMDTDAYWQGMMRAFEKADV